MAVNLSPVGGVAAQFFDNSGNPLTGGKLYTYSAGTTTPAVTYTSSSGATANTNPIVLDAAGRVPNSGEVWLTDGLQYKFVLKTSTDTLLATYDNIVGINSNFVNFTNEQEIQTAIAGQTVFTLTTMQYQPGTTSLSVFVDGVNQYGPGAQYAYLETDSTTVTFISGLHVGAEVKFTTSAINASSYGDAFQISYTPPFTASVATNVGDKLSEWVSPQDFGAAGDSNSSGSTGTNDTSAFALLEAAQSGAVVNMDNKFYLVNSPTPTKNNYINGKFVLANGTTFDQPNNLSLGYKALFSNTFIPNVWPAGGGVSYASGNYNTAIGDSALYSNTTGRRNTALGAFALYSNDTGYYNTAIGPLSLYSNTSGGENTAVGVQAAQSNTTGSDNTIVGSGAFSQHSTSNDCVAVGRQALQIAPASTARVVAIGRQAAWQYNTGTDTVAIGYQALSSAGSVGSYNVAIGSASLGFTTTGDSNVAIGRRAANATTTGAGNVAVGNDAMVGSGLPCTGSNNVAIGNTALPNVTSGDYNVAIGPSACSAITQGIANTVIGRAAGTAITTAGYNVALGEQALTDVTTGIQNTALGSGALAGGAAFNNTTSVGYLATCTASDQVTLGNGSVSSLRCQVALTVVSDERDKVRVAETPGLSFVKNIDSFVGKWQKRDGSQNPNGTFAFFSAQNLQKVQQEFNVDLGLVDTTNTNKLAATYERMIPVLVKAIQELSAEVEMLKSTQ